MLSKLSRIREFKLLLIGNFDYSFDDLDLDVLQWNKQSEIADLGRIDIGVYPLPSTDWVGEKVVLGYSIYGYANPSSCI